MSLLLLLSEATVSAPLVVVADVTVTDQSLSADVVTVPRILAPRTDGQQVLVAEPSLDDDFGDFVIADIGDRMP